MLAFSLKTCGYVVDYVGITQHLKEALSEYASLEGVSEEDKDPMLSVAEDVDRLNSAYNEILTFVRDEVCYDISTQTESVIEELVAVEELRDEYNDLFKKLSKYYDRVLPNPVALQYRDGYKQLAFIRESVANRTRDPRYSMKDASAKIRAIIEEYLDVQGVGLEVPPVDILSPDFIAGVEKPDKTDRAIVDELEYAVREYIIENTPRDPELFERFSEHLNEILESLKGNWQALRKALERFIKTDLFNARKAENTYGYEAVKEMMQPSVYKLSISVSDALQLIKKLKPSIFTQKVKIPNRVFIIDEINRGNISKIFGELITLIEPTKRIGASEQLRASLPYSGQNFGVPDNIYLIGTMNTADRSIARIDAALRRRFNFVEMLPESETLKDILIDGIDIAKMLDTLNKRITVLLDREHTIGHSYFLQPLKADPSIDRLAMIFENEIIPLLQEYFYDDYEKIQLVLGDNQKPDDSTRFIVKKTDALKLFGNADIDFPEYYEINSAAFREVDAYAFI